MPASRAALQSYNLIVLSEEFTKNLCLFRAPNSISLMAGGIDPLVLILNDETISGSTSFNVVGHLIITILP